MAVMHSVLQLGYPLLSKENTGSLLICFNLFQFQKVFRAWYPRYREGATPSRILPQHGRRPCTGRLPDVDTSAHYERPSNVRWLRACRPLLPTLGHIAMRRIL